jgi:hypothetical protein
LNLHLSNGLQAHRRGRFLGALLGLTPTDVQPTRADGMVLMSGEEFQPPSSDQAAWLQWARQPGHALVLLPPYKEGPVVDRLDWIVSLVQDAPTAVALAPLAEALAAEVSFHLSGVDGASDGLLGHLWVNGRSNTRFWKAHSNSGLVAATTLPIWSITLMDSATLVQDWLGALFSHVGKPAAPEPPGHGNSVATPTPQDFAVMVCCHAYGVGSPDALLGALQSQSVQVMNLRGFDVPGIFGRLRAMALIAERGLSPTGLELLRRSAFWGYAAQLKGGK